MTPFQVYLLLQMDRIVYTTMFLAIVIGILGLICSGFGAMETDAGASRFGRRFIGLSMFLFAVFIVVPSTSTVAAMVVLPKLTSPQALDAMGKEGQELYGIVKDALRNLADEKPKDGAK